MRNKMRQALLAGVAVGLAFTTMTSNAGAIFDTLPRDDQANINAECGQTWMTGSLGTANKLDKIEVNTRSGGSGGHVYLAVYENGAASGSTSPWIPTSLVAVSSTTANMSADDTVVTFPFSGETLSDNTRYLFMYVDANTNGVSLGMGLKKTTGTSEQTVFSGGNVVFGGSYTVSSRITTIDLSAPAISSFTASKISVFPNETVTLTWNTTNATSVVLEPGIGAVAASGSTNVVVTGDITYTLTASDTSNSDTKDVDITLNPSAVLYAQYRADLGVTTNGAGVISNWATQTGTANDLDNAIGPTSLATVPRSGGGTADVVSFDGGGSLWSAAGDFGTLGGDRTVAVRARLHGTSNGFLFDGSTSSGKTRAQVRSGMWQAGVQSSGSSFGSADTDTTAITPSIWQTHIFEYEEEGGSTLVTHWIDGVEVGHHTNTVDTALSGLIVGSNGSGSAKLQADVAEILAYRYLLTPSERSSLEADLDGRWGDLNLPLSFQSATVVQTQDVVVNYGTHGIAALELTSSGNLQTDTITNLTYNLNGTTDLGDIEEVQLYSGSSTFSTNDATLIASGLPAFGSIGVNIPVTSEKQYLWIAARLMGSPPDGNRLDAEITEFKMEGAAAGTYIPTVTAPPGYLIIQANAFYSYVLRKEGDDGSGNYRIPGLTTTTNGTVIAVFDVRWDGNSISSPDLPGDIDVAVMRSTDSGYTWGPMQIIMDYDESVPDSDGNGVGDPSILVDNANGRIWCAALWSFGNNGWFGSGPGFTPAETGQFVLNYSDDDGITWTEPVSITPNIKEYGWRLYFQGPGKGICTREGVLIFPAQFKDATGFASSNFIWSDDHGTTWNNAPAAIFDDPAWHDGTLGTNGIPATTESQIVELDNGNLLLSMRNHAGQGKRLWSIYSWNHTTETIVDGSWGMPWFEQTDPVVMASVDRYRSTLDGHPWSGLLFANPDSGSREKMSIRLSLDEGETWPYKRKIDDLPAAYSCMTILPDGDIGILYETGEFSSISRLVFARFSQEWLVGTVDTDSDQMPDFHEDTVGLDKNNPADATEDPDEDGLNNLEEYRAKTDHLDPASVLVSAIEAPGGGLQVAWQSVPYVTYRIEMRESLTDGDWSTVPGLEGIVADSIVTTVALPAAVDPSGFYRVVVQ